MEERIESLETLGDDTLGGVLPRCALIGAVSGVSGPLLELEPLVSEVDRSTAGDLLNSRRRDAPIEEARLGRVSSFLWLSKSISNLKSRTIPENGTADNLLIESEALVDGGL